MFRPVKSFIIFDNINYGWSLSPFNWSLCVIEYYCNSQPQMYYHKQWALATTQKSLRTLNSNKITGVKFMCIFSSNLQHIKCVSTINTDIYLSIPIKLCTMSRWKKITEDKSNDDVIQVVKQQTNMLFDPLVGNLLAPGRCSTAYIKYYVQTCLIDSDHEYFLWNCSHVKTTVLIDDKSTLVQVMDLHHQASSHHHESTHTAPDMEDTLEAI